MHNLIQRWISTQFWINPLVTPEFLLSINLFNCICYHMGNDNQKDYAYNYALNSDITIHAPLVNIRYWGLNSA